jgi:hypothetical protein
VIRNTAIESVMEMENDNVHYDDDDEELRPDLFWWLTIFLDYIGIIEYSGFASSHFQGQEFEEVIVYIDNDEKSSQVIWIIILKI